MTRMRFPACRGRCTVNAPHPALFLVAATRWARPRCVNCGRFTDRWGVRLVVGHFSRQAWREHGPQSVDPGHGDPWCSVCAYTWWGIDATDGPRADALASGWQYLGLPVIATHLRPRADGRGVAHRWRATPR